MVGFVPFLVLFSQVFAVEHFFENNLQIASMGDLRAVVSAENRDHRCFNYDIPEGFDTCYTEAYTLFEAEVPNIREAFPFAYAAAFIHLTPSLERKYHAIQLTLTLASLIRYDNTAEALLKQVNSTNFSDEAEAELRKRIDHVVKKDYWGELPYRALVSPSAVPGSVESLAFAALSMFRRQDLETLFKRHVAMPFTQVYSGMMAYPTMWGAPLVDLAELPPATIKQACRSATVLTLGSPGEDFFLNFHKYPIDKLHEPVLLSQIDTSVKKRESKRATMEMQREFAEASLAAEKIGGQGNANDIFNTATDYMRRRDKQRAIELLESNANRGHDLSRYQLALYLVQQQNEEDQRRGVELEQDMYERGMSAHAITAYRLISAIQCERNYTRAYEELMQASDYERSLSFWRRLYLYYVSGRLDIPGEFNQTSDLLDALEMHASMIGDSSADMLAYFRLGMQLSNSTMMDLYFNNTMRMTEGQRKWLEEQGYRQMRRYNVTIDQVPVDICSLAREAVLVRNHITRPTMIDAEQAYHDGLWGIAFALYSEAALFGIPVAYVNAGDLLLEHPESSGLRHPQMVAALFHAIAAASHHGTALLRLASLPLEPTATQPNVEELMVTSIIGTSLDYIDHFGVEDPRIRTVPLITDEDMADKTNDGRRFRILLHAASRGNSDAVLRCIRILLSRAKRMHTETPEDIDAHDALTERAHALLSTYIERRGHSFDTIVLAATLIWLQHPMRVVVGAIGTLLLFVLNVFLVSLARRYSGSEEELPANIRDIIAPDQQYVDDPDAMAEAIKLSLQTAREEEERRLRGELPATTQHAVDSEEAADVAEETGPAYAE